MRPALPVLVLVLVSVLAPACTDSAAPQQKPPLPYYFTDGGAPDAPPPEMLVEQTTAAAFQDLTVAGDQLFWFDTTGGNCALLSAPKTGGMPPPLAQTNVPESCACSPAPARSFLQADGTTLYWAAKGICSIPVAGGDSTIVVPGVTPTGGFVVAGGKPYWNDAFGTSTLDGAAPKLLSPSGGLMRIDLAASHDALYFVQGADPGHTAPSTLYTLGFTGGAPIMIAPFDLTISGYALGSQAYYVIANEIGIAAQPLTGEMFHSLFATPTPAKTSLSLLLADAKSLYWAEQDRGTFEYRLRTMPLFGGFPITLWSDKGSAATSAVTSIASDGTYVYWTTFDSPTHARVLRASISQR